MKQVSQMNDLYNCNSLSEIFDRLKLKYNLDEKLNIIQKALIIEGLKTAIEKLNISKK